MNPLLDDADHARSAIAMRPPDESLGSMNPLCEASAAHLRTRARPIAMNPPDENLGSMNPLCEASAHLRTRARPIAMNPLREASNPLFFSEQSLREKHAQTRVMNPICASLGMPSGSRVINPLCADGGEFAASRPRAPSTAVASRPREFSLSEALLEEEDLDLEAGDARPRRARAMTAIVGGLFSLALPPMDQDMIDAMPPGGRAGAHQLIDIDVECAPANRTSGSARAAHHFVHDHCVGRQLAKMKFKIGESELKATEDIDVLLLCEHEQSLETGREGTTGEKAEKGESSWWGPYISPSVRTAPERARIREDLAAICVLHALDGYTYRLRHATRGKIRLYRILRGRAYNALYVMVVGAQVALALAEPGAWHRSSHPDAQWAREAVDSAELLIVSLYVCDLLLRMACEINENAVWPSCITYLKRPSNLLKAMMFAAFAMDCELSLTLAPAPYLRFSRVLRPIVVLTSSSWLREHFRPMQRATTKIVGALGQMLVVVAIFGTFGVHMFGQSRDWVQPVEELEECGFSFRDPLEALTALIVLVTAENFPCVMLPALRGRVRFDNATIAALYPTVDENNPNAWSRVADTTGREHIDSATYQALLEAGQVEPRRFANTFFFTTFILVCVFVVLNVLIGIVWQTFRNHRDQLALARHIKARRSLLLAFELIAVHQDSLLVVERGTWMRLMKSVRPSWTEDRLEFLFSKQDEDDSGSIDALEFLHAADVLHLIVNKVPSAARPGQSSIMAAARQRAAAMIRTNLFRGLITAILALGTVLFILKSFVSYERRAFHRAYWILDALFTWVFFVELILRLLAMGAFHYFSSVWRTFDAGVALASVGSLVMFWAMRIDEASVAKIAIPEAGAHSKASYHSLRLLFIIAGVARSLRTLRLYSVHRIAKEPRRFFSLLMQAVPPFAAQTLFVFLVFYVYSIIGQELFSEVQLMGLVDQESYIGFDSFLKSLTLLTQLITASNWHGVMLETQAGLIDRWGDSYKKTCCSLSRIYFISFILLCVTVLLNLLLSIVVDYWLLACKLELKAADDETPPGVQQQTEDEASASACETRDTEFVVEGARHELKDFAARSNSVTEPHGRSVAEELKDFTVGRLNTRNMRKLENKKRNAMNALRAKQAMTLS